MKLKHIRIGFLLTAMFMFTSCAKILEVETRSQITNQVYWQNEEDFEVYLIGIYGNFRGRMNELAFGEERSESFVQGNNPQFSAFWSQIITPERSRSWSAYYGLIGHVNLLLSKMDTFSFKDQNKMKRTRGEALALRAAMYFYLAKIWGDVPLMLLPVENENVPLLPRSQVSEIFKQINADVEASLELFTDNNFVSKYRFARPSVNALKADVKMWTARVLNGGDEDLKTAIAAVEAAQTGGVTLLPDFRNITQKGNNEILLSIYFDRNETNAPEAQMYARQAFPLSNYSGAADNAKDLPITSSPNYGGAGFAVSPQVLALFSAYPQDKRIPVTFITEIRGGKPGIIWPNKFRGKEYSDARFPEDDIIVYRLADLLLLKAEAHAALGQLPQALSALNLVRARAGIPEFRSENKLAVEKEILDERGRELFHENKRWWDLVRAHRSGVIDVYSVVPNLKGKTTPLFWPVPVSVISLNPKITQTEGY